MWFPAFYGTRRFITVFRTARHWSVSWARWIQSTPSHTVFVRSILTSSSHLLLGFPSCIFLHVLMFWRRSRTKYVRPRRCFTQYHSACGYGHGKRTVRLMICNLEVFDSVIEGFSHCTFILSTSCKERVSPVGFGTCWDSNEIGQTVQRCGSVRTDEPRCEVHRNYGSYNDCFLLVATSRLALGPTQPPVHGAPGTLSPGIKRSGHETDHSHLVPRSRMRAAMPLFPYVSSWHGA